MSETAISPTPSAAPAATPATPEPASAPQGTAQPQSSEAQVASTPAAGAEAAPTQEESFYSGDPNSLPPELRKSYDNMLTDYKKKTQEIAEVRKRAEAYDYLSRDQQFIDLWNKRLQGEQKATQVLEKVKEGIDVPDEEFNKALDSKQEFLNLVAKVAKQANSDIKRELDTTKQELTTAKAQDALDAFAESHKDLYELEDYGFLSYQFKADPTIKLEDAYKNAKRVRDDIFKKGYEKAKAEYMANAVAKANASTEVPTASSPNAYSGPDPKKLSAAEALAYARRGIVVPQH